MVVVFFKMGCRLMRGNEHVLVPTCDKHTGEGVSMGKPEVVSRSLTTPTHSAMLISQDAPRPSCLCISASGISGLHHRTWLFSHGSGDQNLGSSHLRSKQFGY